MTALGGVLAIARLTLLEALRRRVLTAALIAGAAFLAFYAMGIHFIIQEELSSPKTTLIERRMMLNVLTLAGLFAANLLMIMIAVLLPVDTLSGEIASGVMQTVASRPIRRRDIVLGKWLGHWIVLTAYVVLLVGGVLAITAALAHFTPRGSSGACRSCCSRDRPLDALHRRWRAPQHRHERRARVRPLRTRVHRELGGADRHHGRQRRRATGRDDREPRDAERVALAARGVADAAADPARPRQFAVLPVSVPSAAMVWWAVGYILLVLALGVRWFRKRPL